jgi:putative oxidoreductase
VPLVPVPPLPDALPVDDVPVVTVVPVVVIVVVVVAVFVTGVPPPVSVAVVPVVDGCSVSVDPTVLSFGLRLQATARASRAMRRTFLISKVQSGIVHMSLARFVKAFRKRGVVMPQIVGRTTGPAFAIMRIVVGLLFCLHGSQKILGWPPMQGAPPGGLPTIAIVAGWIEIVCGALIVIGLFGGLAAFIASGEMAVAFFMGHAMPSHDIVPLRNQGEVAVLYCFVFLYIAAHGSGMWSLDSILRKRTMVTESIDAGHA